MSQHITFVDDEDGSALEVSTTPSEAVRIQATASPGESTIVMVDLAHDDAVAFAKAVLDAAEEAA